MKIPKKYLFIFLFICIFAVSATLIYILHNKAFSFSERIHETQIKVVALEENKKVLNLYKKILVEGSKEQQDIEKYILTSKNTFAVVSRIEKDAQGAGLIGKDKGGITSVASRENGQLEKYDAHELVINLRVQQDSAVVDRYIEALSKLPYVSHIEKVSISFDNKTKTSSADITLVLTESK